MDGERNTLEEEKVGFTQAKKLIRLIRKINNDEEIGLEDVVGIPIVFIDGGMGTAYHPEIPDKFIEKYGLKDYDSHLFGFLVLDAKNTRGYRVVENGSLRGTKEYVIEKEEEPESPWFSEAVY